MATLILLNKTELPKGTPSEALVAVWDKGSVPDGQHFHPRGAERTPAPHP